MTENEIETDDTQRNPPLSEQMDGLNQNMRELCDEVLLKPVTTALNAVGVETADIDEQSEDVSLIETTGAALLGPVLANLRVVVGFYAGIQLTQSPEFAVVIGGVVGLVAGVAGLFAGFRYLASDTEQSTES